MSTKNDIVDDPEKIDPLDCLNLGLFSSLTEACDGQETDLDKIDRLQSENDQLREDLEISMAETSQAKADIGYMLELCRQQGVNLFGDPGLTKPIAQMTREEIVAANKRVAERRGNLHCKSPDALPQPTAEQAEALAREQSTLIQDNFANLLRAIGAIPLNENPKE